MAKIASPRLLIHSLIFPPDQVSTSYLYGDISQAFIEAGWEVEVFTTVPHYNYQDDFGKHGSRGLLGYRSNFHGARVFHVPQVKSKNIAKRGLYILWFHLLFIFRGLFGKSFSVILTPSPPLSSGFLSGWIARLRGAKAVYNVQEVYPDILIKSGQLKSGRVLKMLKYLERKTYEWSSLIITIDNQFAKAIEPRLDANKLRIIPNFVDTELYRPTYGDIPALKALEGKFLVAYIGNLGKVQDWDAVFQAADLLQTDDNIHFLLIGGGSEYELLRVNSEKRSNIDVLPYQQRELVPIINTRVDLHLICMNEASDMDGLPSKVYTILSCERPILAATSSNSPLSTVVEQSGNGRVVPLGDSREIADAILKFREGNFTELSGSKGRQFVLDTYSKSVVTNQYVQSLESILK